MHRHRIIEATDKLRDALQAAQIRDVLRASRDAEKSEDVARTQKILTAYSTFAQHYANFGDDEKYLMSVLGLTPLVNVDFWSGLLDRDESVSHQLISDVDVGVYNVVYILPKFSDLLIRETDKENLCIKLMDGIESEVQRLRVYIGEPDGALIDTGIITNVIRAVEDMYEGVSSLYRKKFVPLAIGSIDSGSAKCFDFFGDTEVVREVGDLLGGVWERVKPASADELGYQIEVALVSTGFVARAGEAQRRKQVSEEECQRLTRLVSRSIEVLFRSGAYTEDMDRVEERRASELLVPGLSAIEHKSDGPKTEEKKLALRDTEGPIDPQHIQNVAEMPKTIPETIESVIASGSAFGRSRHQRTTEEMSRSLSELARNMSEIASQIERPDVRLRPPATRTGPLRGIAPYPPEMEENETDEIGHPFAATGND